jgi:putative transposase
VKQRRHTPEQVIRKLREADRMLGEGRSIADVCKALEVCEPTYHRWRNKYGGMKADDAKRLRELERENARLKRIVADQALETQALKEIAGKLVSPARRRRAVLMLQNRLGGSERWACRVVGHHRSTQSHQPVDVNADDQTADGRVLKLLHIVDEFAREALAMHVARRIDADQTAAVFERLAARRGTPAQFAATTAPN